MNELTLLLNSLDPHIIYTATQEQAWLVYSRISPVLLLIAVAVRVFETQLDGMGSLDKWQRALKDMLLWGTVLSLYFAVMTLINGFMNEIFAVIYNIGNVDDLMIASEKLINKAAVAEGKTGVPKFFNDYSVPMLVISALYWGSFFLVTAMHVFLKGAHAVIYSVVIIYGLIAIPISITANFKLLKGWLLLLGGLMLWPVIEAIILGSFGLIFQGATAELLKNPEHLAQGMDEAFKAFFAVMNIVTLVILIVSPLIAGYLVMNTSALFQLTMPFITGGLAIGFAGIKGATTAGKMAMSGGKTLTEAGKHASLMSAITGAAAGPIGASAGLGTGGPTPNQNHNGGMGPMGPGGSAPPPDSNSNSSSASPGSSQNASSGGGPTANANPNPTANDAETQEKERKRKNKTKGFFANKHFQSQKPKRSV